MEQNRFSEQYEAPDQTVQVAHDQIIENPPTPPERPIRRKKSRRNLGDIALQKVHPLALEVAHDLARRPDGTVDYSRITFNEDGSITVD